MQKQKHESGNEKGEKKKTQRKIISSSRHASDGPAQRNWHLNMIFPVASKICKLKKKQQQKSKTNREAGKQTEIKQLERGGLGKGVGSKAEQN